MKTKMRSKKKWIIAAIVMLLLLFWIWQRHDPKPYATKTTQEPVPVKVVVVKEKGLHDSVTTQGNITGNEIELRFEIPGTLKQFKLKPGAPVKQGDMIAQMDDQDAALKIQYRKSKVEALEAQYLAAESKLKLYEDLFSTGYLLPAKLEEMRYEKESKEKEWQSASLELLSAQKEYEKVFLKAPVDGVIAEVESAEGEFVPLGTKVASLIDAKNLYLELTVSESHLRKIEIGQQVRLKTHPLRDRNFVGVIEGMVPLIDDKSRTAKVKVRLSELDTALVPGMFVRAEIALYENEGALVIPRSCLVQKEESAFVMVVDSQNQASLRTVEIGYATDEKVEIVSGLAEGEKIIAEFPERFQGGEPIKIVSQS
jgi:RND family efflux transporter MFP subunit